MRLLIAEDEFYTRQGIIDEIDLADIGFDEVAQADDGVNALRIARTFKPDVVLADVRMPRMDGVEMCYSLRRLFPDCSIVFMSGYADKEYLKAAIELQATCYVEKPFRTTELRDVLRRAAELRGQVEERRRREAALLRKAEAGGSLLRSEAALLLVQYDPGDPRVRQAVEVSGLGLGEDTPLVVAMVRPAGVQFADEGSFRERLAGVTAAAAAAAGLQGLAALQGGARAVIVLATAAGRGKLLAEREAVAAIRAVLAAFPAEQLIAGVSAPAQGVPGARAACAAAASALDAAFFLGPGSVAHDASAGREALPMEPSAIDEFQACLDRDDGEAALALLHAQSERLRAAATRDTFAAREYLTRVLLRLVAFAERRGIPPFEDGMSVRPSSERIERAGTLQSALSVVENVVTGLFARLAEHAADGRIVSDIKRAVHRGYALPSLSTEDIAHAAGVSATYACRVFKDATGETIHRYMTAYRLERAKDLLRDARQPKMAEIAARAGFSDANYFARAFRRETGMSPSEFRESAS